MRNFAKLVHSAHATLHTLRQGAITMELKRANKAMRFKGMHQASSLIKLARPGVHLKDLERLWQKNRENMGEDCGARSARKGRP